jgi:hypothetical protein
MTDVLDVVVENGARVRSVVEAAAAGDISEWSPDEATERIRTRAIARAVRRWISPAIMRSRRSSGPSRGETAQVGPFGCQ